MNNNKLNIKFWAINFVAFTIIIAYLALIVYEQFSGDRHYTLMPFYASTPLQVMFMISVGYLFTEGKLIQKILLAKRIKDDEIMEEFKVVHKVAKETKIRMKGRDE